MINNQPAWLKGQPQDKEETNKKQFNEYSLAGLSQTCVVWLIELDKN